MARQKKPAEYLLFIDTNVLLDFYRTRNDIGLHLLGRIDKNHEKIITTHQLEMEFKKNRQAAIREALDNLKAENAKTSVPAFLKEAKAVASMGKSEKRITTLVKGLRTRTIKLFSNPTTHDPVYKPIQRLFRASTILNLHDRHEDWLSVCRSARKRFLLGHPPRKSSDTSIGDAVNWEWMIRCVKAAKKNLVIVSRDSDYGVTINGKVSYINDWLLQEFRTRVGRRAKLVLTQKLSEAFKLTTGEISDAEVREEETLLQRRAGESLQLTLTSFVQPFGSGSRHSIGDFPGATVFYVTPPPEWPQVLPEVQTRLPNDLASETKNNVGEDLHE